jgi:hypothetical protein
MTDVTSLKISKFIKYIINSNIKGCLHLVEQLKYPIEQAITTSNELKNAYTTDLQSKKFDGKRDDKEFASLKREYDALSIVLETELSKKLSNYLPKLAENFIKNNEECKKSFIENIEMLQTRALDNFNNCIVSSEIHNFSGCIKILEESSEIFL